MTFVDRAGPGVIVRRAGAALRLGWQSAPRCMSAIVALTVVDGAAPVAVAWVTKLLLDELAYGSSAAGVAVGYYVGALVALGLVVVAANAAQAYLGGVLHRSIRLNVQMRLFRRINAYTGLAPFEDPGTLDRIRLAEQAGDSAPEEAIGAAVHLVQATITIAGFAGALLLLWPPMVAFVVAAAIPATALQLRLGRLRADMTTGVSTLQRRQIFYRVLVTDVRAAKEVRLFGLGEFLGGRMVRDLRAANAAEQAVDRSAALTELLLGALGGVLSLIGISVAAYQALHGRLSVGDVTVLLAAVVALHGTVTTATGNVARAYQALLLFGHYVSTVNDPVPAQTGLSPGPLTEGIEFDDVWFRYADGLPWVLRGASFRLPARGAIGLVGVNGVGKSTIVKLLCRLYEPQRGSIRWDGVELSQLDPALLRARISAVFQDFMAYDLSASENIGIGWLEALSDPDRIRRAAQLADVDDAIARLPRGYDTLLSRIFPADTDENGNASLSGGQWQRIALARAFLREHADLLILDEPTSGLDAQSEHSLHRRLAALRTGRLSLLISHRLNALRDADKILVLEAGRVVEAGNHAQLLAAGGHYAELFTLQSEGYQLTEAAIGPTG